MTHVVVSIVKHQLGQVIACSTFDEAVKVAMGIIKRSEMFDTLDGIEENLKYGCEYHFRDSPSQFSIYIGLLE